MGKLFVSIASAYGQIPLLDKCRSTPMMKLKAYEMNPGQLCLTHCIGNSVRRTSGYLSPNSCNGPQGKRKRIAIIYKKRLHSIMLLRFLEPITEIECQAFENETKSLEWLRDFLPNQNTISHPWLIVNTQSIKKLRWPKRYGRIRIKFVLENECVQRSACGFFLTYPICITSV